MTGKPGLGPLDCTIQLKRLDLESYSGEEVDIATDVASKVARLAGREVAEQIGAKKAAKEAAAEVYAKLAWPGLKQPACDCTAGLQQDRYSRSNQHYLQEQRVVIDDEKDTAYHSIRDTKSSSVVQAIYHHPIQPEQDQVVVLHLKTLSSIRT